MTTRVTNSMLVRTALDGVFRQRIRLADAQEQAASGLRVNRPSDDPTSASHAAQVRAEGGAIDQYRRNIVQARARLVTAEDALRAGEDVIVRAKEIAIQGANGVMDAGARQLLAQEVESLYDEMLASGNVRNSGGWIFAGTASATQAFVSSGGFVSGSPPPTVAFAGSSTQIEVAIDEGRRATTTLDGRRVFMGDGNGDAVPDAGRDDAFAVIGELWRALDTDDQTAIAATLDRLDSVQLQFELEIAHVGAATQQLDVADDRLDIERISATASLSDAEDIDAEEVFSRIVAHETALQAALETAARAIQHSLMDFLS
jgi:flagellar hook-associated protein 3 FlgL